MNFDDLTIRVRIVDGTDGSSVVGALSSITSTVASKISGTATSGTYTL